MLLILLHWSICKRKLIGCFGSERKISSDVAICWFDILIFSPMTREESPIAGKRSSWSASFQLILRFRSTYLIAIISRIILQICSLQAQIRSFEFIVFTRYIYLILDRFFLQIVFLIHSFLCEIGLDRMELTKMPTTIAIITNTNVWMVVLKIFSIKPWRCIIGFLCVELTGAFIRLKGTFPSLWNVCLWGRFLLFVGMTDWSASHRNMPRILMLFSVFGFRMMIQTYRMWGSLWPNLAHPRHMLYSNKFIQMWKESILINFNLQSILAQGSNCQHFLRHQEFLFGFVLDVLVLESALFCWVFWTKGWEIGIAEDIFRAAFYLFGFGDFVGFDCEDLVSLLFFMCGLVVVEELFKRFKTHATHNNFIDFIINPMPIVRQLLRKGVQIKTIDLALDFLRLGWKYLLQQIRNLNLVLMEDQLKFFVLFAIDEGQSLAMGAHELCLGGLKLFFKDDLLEGHYCFIEVVVFFAHGWA